MRLFRVVALSLVLVPRGQADYFDATGYRELAAELGASLPDGSGVGVTQVEYGNPEYLPQAGSGTFLGSGAYFGGKTFSAQSGASDGSGHAADVGLHLYSLNTNPAAGRASFTPGIGVIDLYRVDPGETSTAWTQQAWLRPGTNIAPLTEARAVQNHSWISVGNAGSADEDNEALRRLDFAVRRDGFLPVTGVNNGASAVPALMASAYNNLAVGLSSGAHSTGGVVSWLDGPGRQKPELVAPLDYTSFSTPLVGSAAALLRQTAGTQGPNASRPETIKAILLAGATKEEFPGWTRTATAPLDPVYGAGELNIAHSWHILAGLEQAPNQTTARPGSAWSMVTLTTNTTANYLVRVPPGSVGETFSAIAAWNRVVNDIGPGNTFIMSVATLANYQLSFARVPASGNPVVLDQSISSLENVEHIHQTGLPSGTYRLRLSLASGSNVPAAVAWRLQSAPHRPGISLSQTATSDALTFTGLLPGQAYLIQSSANLSRWDPVQAFTATGTTFAWTGAKQPGRLFYRLAATD
jgi:hypothetical protein